MQRILTVLSAPCWADAQEALLSAVRAARSPGTLTFGLFLEAEPLPEELAEMCAAASVQFVVGPRGDWETFWRGEPYVLLGHRAMRFDTGWNQALLNALPENALLTGCLPRTEDPVDAVAPAAADERLPDGGVCLRRGIPLRYAVKPVRAAFRNPGFCFGSVGALRQGKPLYTLHQPVIRLEWDDPLPDVSAEAFAAAAEEQPLLDREGNLSPQARTGIITSDLDFLQSVPRVVRAYERRRVRRTQSAVRPLWVSAFVPEPGVPESLLREGLQHFRYAADMAELPLLIFAAPGSVDRLLRYHPNVLTYTQRCMLPGGQGTDAVRLGKPWALEQALHKMPECTHLIWMDYDALPFPVCSEAAVDASALCEERIVIALVGEEPDTSMIAVPAEMLEALCRETALLCAERKKNPPTEAELWGSLMLLHPDWFRAVEMPGPGQLITLALSRRGEEPGTRP